ncbi:MAG TPA: hypothetical protein VHB21_23885 [Minicystis sp.]|nr:hypothetical protein [Minicystis sp.]
MVPTRRMLGLLALPLATAAALALVPIACGGDPPLVTIGGGCLINSDCNSPLVCAFRRCHTQCETDRDCQQGERCVVAERPDRVCQLEDEQTCQYNSECPGNEVCGVDDQCRDACAADRDCVPGQVCKSGTCADPSELVDGGLPAADGGQGKGQPCSYTSDCPEPYVCKDGLCDDECLGDRDCPGSTCDETTHQCVRADGGLLCLPGQVFLCGCPDMSDGRQECNDAGTGVGNCVCPDAG